VYPLVLLPVLVLTQPQGEVISQWLVDVIGWQIGGAVLRGAILGYGSSRLLTWTESVGIVEKGTFLAYTFALTFVVLGAARLLGVDGVLAAFVAGIAYRMGPGTAEPTEEAQIQQAMTKFFALPAFVFVGLAIPWDAWLELGWRGLVLAVLIFTPPATTYYRGIVSVVPTPPNAKGDGVHCLVWSNRDFDALLRDAR